MSRPSPHSTAKEPKFSKKMLTINTETENKIAGEDFIPFTIKWLFSSIKIDVASYHDVFVVCYFYFDMRRWHHMIIHMNETPSLLQYVNFCCTCM